MRLAVPDLVSNSYFPAVAAVELGTFRDQGLGVETSTSPTTARRWWTMSTW